jgi:diguanylate cyclase (GGDEF)-like protein
MAQRLRRAFFPRYEGEERALHFRLIHLVLRVWGIALAAWFLGRFLLYLTIGYQRGPSLSFEIFSILFSILALGVGYLLANRQHLLASGYLLATAAWFYPTLNGILNPSELYLIGPVSIVAVFIAGAILSPAAGYLYAAASVISAVAVFVMAPVEAGATALGLAETSGIVFLVVQTAILFFAAAMMHAYSTNAHGAIQRLNRQTLQMTELAHTDSLTGLANRRWLLELLEREFLRARRYRRPLSLIYLDLDGFKEVNDGFGHLFGDGLLRSAARSMQAVLRAADMLARIGGDEFAILLPETDLAGADKVVVKLRRALLSTTRPYGTALPPLTFSAGICQLREADRTIDDLILRADEAQYLAKSGGRGETRTEIDLGRPAATQAAAASPAVESSRESGDGPDPSA